MTAIFWRYSRITWWVMRISFRIRFSAGKGSGLQVVRSPVSICVLAAHNGVRIRITGPDTVQAGIASLEADALLPATNKLFGPKGPLRGWPRTMERRPLICPNRIASHLFGKESHTFLVKRSQLYTPIRLCRGF